MANLAAPRRHSVLTVAFAVAIVVTLLQWNTCEAFLVVPPTSCRRHTVQLLSGAVLPPDLGGNGNNDNDRQQSTVIKTKQTKHVEVSPIRPSQATRISAVAIGIIMLALVVLPTTPFRAVAVDLEQTIQQVDRVVSKQAKQASKVVSQETSKASKVVSKETKKAVKVASQEIKVASKTVEKEAKVATKEANKVAKTVSKKAKKTVKVVKKEAKKGAKVVSKETQKAVRVASKEATKASKSIHQQVPRNVQHAEKRFQSTN